MCVGHFIPYPGYGYGGYGYPMYPGPRSYTGGYPLMYPPYGYPPPPPLMNRPRPPQQRGRGEHAGHRKMLNRPLHSLAQTAGGKWLLL